MKTLKIIFVFILVFGLWACEKDPKVAAGDFEIILKEVASTGHYTYTLSVLKGEGFTENVSLEILSSGGATGDVKVSGEEYTGSVVLSGETKVEYLPLSAGDHKIELRATGGGKTKSKYIQVEEVTALSKNELMLPYKARDYDPEFGVAAEYRSADDNIVSVYNNKLYWHGDGSAWIYATVGGVRTGCKVTTDVYRELEYIIVEVNGVVSTPDNLYMWYPESATEDISVKVIGIYPENASNFNPSLFNKHFGTAQRFRDLKGKTFTNNNYDGTINIHKDEMSGFPAKEVRIYRSGLYGVTITTPTSEDGNIYMARNEKIQLTAAATPEWEQVIWSAHGSGGLMVSDTGVIEWDPAVSKPSGYIQARIRKGKYGEDYDEVSIRLKE